MTALRTAAGPIVRALADRRSVRGFLPTSVDDETVRRVVESAAQAPSWCNIQPWRAYLIRDAPLKMLSQELVAAARARDQHSDVIFPPAPEGLLRQRKNETDTLLRHARTGIHALDPREEIAAVYRNWQFYSAPQALLLTVARDRLPYALLDLGCFLQSLLLALTEEGVAGCPQASLAQFAPVVRRHIPIPETEAIACGVSFGHPDPSVPAPRTPRADITEILHLPVPTPTERTM